MAVARLGGPLTRARNSRLTPPSIRMASRPLPAPEALETQLLTLISERLLEVPRDFGVESDLFAHGLDSMAIMQFLLLIEEEFGISIPERELTRQNFGSVKSVAVLLRTCAHAPA